MSNNSKKIRFSPQARSIARERTLQALYQWQVTGQAIQIIFQQFTEEPFFLDDNDEACPKKSVKVDEIHFEKLLLGVANDIKELDELMIPLLDRQITQLDPIELVILRMGIYELKSCKKIPFKVVINEAVNLTKKFGADKSHKYINSILDKIATKLKVNSSS
ncbi:MAG: transcription antitermination factor NusB [Thiomargarita sp.]|nr:transcription antitermination factor NusB [Thiomargarita sp.]